MVAGGQRWSQETVARAGALLVLSKLVLTASFLGVLALVTGSVTGLGTRLPFYVLAMAIAFVGSVIVFEGEFRDGYRILQSAVVIGAATLLLVALSGEGIAYAVQRPGQVLTSQLLFYLLAAGLIGTGLGYWGVRHWNDITAPRAGL